MFRTNAIIFVLRVSGQFTLNPCTNCFGWDIWCFSRLIFRRLVFICFYSFIYLSPLHLLRLFACNMKSQTQPRRIIAKSTKLIKNSQMNDNNLRRCFTCIANWIRKCQNYVSLRWFDAWICDSRIIFFFFGQIQMHQCNALHQQRNTKRFRLVKSSIAGIASFVSWKLFFFIVIFMSVSQYRAIQLFQTVINDDSLSTAMKSDKIMNKQSQFCRSQLTTLYGCLLAIRIYIQAKHTGNIWRRIVFLSRILLMLEIFW